MPEQNKQETYIKQKGNNLITANQRINKNEIIPKNVLKKSHDQELSEVTKNRYSLTDEQNKSLGFNKIIAKIKKNGLYENMGLVASDINWIIQTLWRIYKPTSVKFSLNIIIEKDFVHSTIGPINSEFVIQSCMYHIAKILQTKIGRNLLKDLILKTNSTVYGIRIKHSFLRAKDSATISLRSSDKYFLINYNALLNYFIMPTTNTAGPHPTSGDITLFHELVHAYHTIENKLDKLNPKNYHLNEFIAIGSSDYLANKFTENNYRNEQRILNKNNDLIKGYYKTRPRIKPKTNE